MRLLLLVLSLLLLAAAPGAEGVAMAGTASPGGAPEVKSVTLELDRGLSEEQRAELDAIVSIRPGDRLSRRELSRTTALLYATGRFADVSADVAAEGEGVRVAFRLVPRRHVRADRIGFEGAQRISDEKLFKALRITSSRVEYFPENMERLADLLKTAYRRIGHDRAQVSYRLETTENGGDRIVFTIDEGAASRLQTLSFSGQPGFPLDQLTEVLGLNLGDVLSQDGVKSGMDRLRKFYREQGYYMARFGQPAQTADDDGNATLQVQVNSGLKVDIDFQGNEMFTSGELARLLAYSGEERLTEGGADDLAVRLQTKLRLSGFPDARVSASLRPMPQSGRALLLFTVSEGGWLRVKGLQYRGVRRLDEGPFREELHEALYAAAQRIAEEDRANGAFALGGPDSSRVPDRPLVVPEELYLEPLYKAHEESLKGHYQDEGFLGVKVYPHVLARDDEARTGEVTFKVTEGVQTLVAEVDVAPPPEGLTRRRVREALKLEPGKPFSHRRLAASKEGIAQVLRSGGYLYSGVKESLEIQDTGRKAHVYFDLQPGPRVRLGRLVIRGHERTSESVIRAALAFKEGDILTQEGIQQSQKNLVKLGIFRSVRITMESPDLAEETKDLTILLDERKTWAMSVGAGYSLMDGVRVMAEVTKINLFGQALQLQIQGKLNFLETSPLPSIRDAQSGLEAIGRKVNVGLIYPHAPWLLPLDVTLRANILHEYLLRTSYTFQQTAGILGADFNISKALSFSLQYEIEEVIVNRLKSDADQSAMWIDKQRLRFEEGRVYLHSVKPLVRLDFRDSAIAPRKGIMLTGQVELVKSLNAPDDEIEPFFFLKLQGQANAYVPLPARSVLALSLSGGKVFPLDSEGKSRTIVPKRFFMGGAISQRGFMDDALVPEDVRRSLHGKADGCEADDSCSSIKHYTSEGGELFTLAKAEIRIPLGASQFELAVFFDAGNLWLDQEAFEMWSLRYSAGVGLRMLTPIGPAALDLGVNLNPDKVIGESRFVPHFSIGMF